MVNLSKRDSSGNVRRAGAGGKTDLFQKSPFLNNVGNGLLSDAACFVDVLESIKLFRPLILDNSDLQEWSCQQQETRRHRKPYLAKSTFSNSSMEVEVVEGNFGVEIDGLRETATDTSHLSFLIARRRQAAAGLVKEDENTRDSVLELELECDHTM